MPRHLADALLAVKASDKAAANPNPSFVDICSFFMVFLFGFAVALLRLALKSLVSPEQISATNRRGTAVMPIR